MGRHDPHKPQFALAWPTSSLEALESTVTTARRAADDQVIAGLLEDLALVPH